MQNLPQRNSLVSQTSAFLRQEINRGGWKEWLPSERTLCESLQVSRNTLRAALEQLKRENLVDARHGAGNRINTRQKPRSDALRSHDVAILTPDPLEQLRPSHTLWIDEMRAMLSERGCRLHVINGRQYFRANPGPALRKLVTQQAHGCWVLMLSNEKTQLWFEKNGIPCVVAGSVYTGIDLPFRDLDHKAICRHAAGVMLGAGHRRVGLLIQKTERAGDLESEAGFIAGVRSSSHADAEVVVGHHEPTVTGFCNTLRRLLEQKPAPTALLVANPNYYISAITRLAQLGYRVPRDISVLSRDDDPFLSYFLPAPTRYVTNPRTLAKTLLRPVLELLEGGVVTHRTIRIMPDFIRGESLTAPGGR
jgi:LacI family transcriptional regulator